MRLPRFLPVVCLAAVFAGSSAARASAQTGANVLVVANESSPASLQIAGRYAARRAVPSEQVLRVKVEVSDEISRPDYERLIQGPIAAWLAAHQAQDRILYIVLTKGIPLRIAGTAGRTGTMASVDSELTLLYRRMTGQFVGFDGKVSNPFFATDGVNESVTRFSHAKHDIYLVTRLDGFTVADALALIDRAAVPVATGRILLDQRAGLNDLPNTWLSAAAKALEAAGIGDRVTLETTSRTLDGEKDVLGYYSWGSNDPAQTARRPNLEFVPGAIAGMFVSSDARTFIEPPATWKPNSVQLGMPFFYAGSQQSLTGDLIRAGVTGIGGQVAEPYLDSSIRPDILFPAYLAGYNLAESFYMAIPALSWQTVVIGDPLCAPVTRESLPAEVLAPGIDPPTELPASFAARRLASSGIRTSSEAALALVIQGQSRVARSDKSGARESFEKAVAADDTLNDVWLLLATAYEEAGENDKADGIYRKILERLPNEPIALNNLAYSLAVRHGKPQEALPLVERANLVSPGSAVIADTLGWVRHLLGDHVEASRLLVRAARTLTQNADVQLHAAAALAAAGRLEDATKFLKAAEALDAKVRDRPEYREVLRRTRR